MRWARLRLRPPGEQGGVSIWTKASTSRSTTSQACSGVVPCAAGRWFRPGVFVTSFIRLIPDGTCWTARCNADGPVVNVNIVLLAQRRRKLTSDLPRVGYATLARWDRLGAWQGYVRRDTLTTGDTTYDHARGRSDVGREPAPNKGDDSP